MTLYKALKPVILSHFLNETVRVWWRENKINQPADDMHLEQHLLCHLLTSQVGILVASTFSALLFYTRNHIFRENGSETMNLVFLCENGIPKSSKFRCKRKTMCIVNVDRNKHSYFVLHMLVEKTNLVLSFVKFRVAMSILFWSFKIFELSIALHKMEMKKLEIKELFMHKTPALECYVSNLSQ